MSQPDASPFFSVVMPVYNGERYLSAAIESLTRQTLRDWEMIVVDDASSDKTPEILTSYAAKHLPIRIFRNETNAGAGRSLNRGIREARGEWVVHLDSDDLFAPDYLEVLRSSIAELPQPHGFVSSWVTVIDGEGEKVLDLCLPSAEKIVRMMDYENFLYHSATSFPKQVWSQVGGYPEDRKICEDAGMWRRFFKNRISLFMIPKSLVFYRIHDSNYTSFKDRPLTERADRERAVAQQYHEWRTSLFLKQGDLRAARHEIVSLKKIQPSFSIKNLFYYGLTLLPKFAVYGFMWEVRPRMRRLVKTLTIGLSRARPGHYSV